MSAETQPIYEEGSPPLVRPWPLLAAGLVTVAAGAIWALVTSSGETARILLIFAGLVAIGSALPGGLRRLGESFADRLVPASMLIVALGAILLAWCAVAPAWGSNTTATAA